MRRPNLARAAIAFLGAVAIALALFRLADGAEGLLFEETAIDGTPVTLVSDPGAPSPRPAVVVAHGFSGSRPLMRAFSATLARAGYTAVMFDFLGHGRSPQPLTGDLLAEDGATAALLAELERVIAFARQLPGVDGLALLGHSMASDIVIRAAVRDPGIAATVAISMFSPAVEADLPRNLLILVGEWEPRLLPEALRALRLSAGPEARAGETYGDFADGSARRAETVEGAEHVAILYDPQALRAARDWIDRAFSRSQESAIVATGGWALLLIAGLVALYWPLSRLLPRASAEPAGAGLSWRRLRWPIFAPAVLTPLLLWPVKPRLLPIVVGDYLALHFATYGLLTAAALALVARDRLPSLVGLRAPAPCGLPRGVVIPLAAAAGALWALLVLGEAVGTWVSNFTPIPARLPLIAALFVGALPFFLADEWMTRGRGAAPFAYAATKALFLLSLAVATALDLERLFFLILMGPPLILFFIVYGLFSRWTYGATRHPAAGALANALVFAWAIGVTFPMIAG